ncbi:MtrAB system histidine kinase MtrB [Actinomycetaceae bacterium MB13-C1-2]|nr:MtrAB system histidine kinase MtrB [Actinomycetaceae bacterium MB13-C1-2]
MNQTPPASGNPEGTAHESDSATDGRVARLETPSWLAGSLSTRIAATLAAFLTIVLALFTFWVATQLRTGLFEQRRDAILEDASFRFSAAQGSLNQSVAATPDQVQESAAQILNSMLESARGAGAVGVYLTPTQRDASAVRINALGSSTVEELAAQSGLRKVLVHDEGAWQSVPLEADDRTEPAILAGTLIDLPLAGESEVYILYSLANEQKTVDLVINVLMWGAVPILIIMSLLTFYLVYRMLRPVRHAAVAAERLADGDLDSRVNEKGRDEMAMLGRAFNDMADSLSKQIHDYDELSQFQQRFVSDVSHELRTPLTTIRMAEDMIYEERDELSPAGHRSAELLHSEAQRFEEMLADLLEISRYDANSAKLEGESTDVYSLVQKVINANAGLAGRLGVEVQLSARPERCSVPLDPKRMERVVRNLLVNAYEHSEGNPVEVTVAAGETSVALRVRDYGVGMSPETAKQVFDRFFRADPARARTTGGTGLGLAITKEDVELHNGVINVWGEPGKGASFVVTLPREALSAVTEFPLMVWEGE